MKFTVEVAGRSLDVEVDEDGVRLNGRRVDARLEGEQGAPTRRLVRGRSGRLFAAAAEGRGTWQLSVGGARLLVSVLDPREQAVRAAATRSGAGRGTGKLKAPMPGLVLRVLVAEGAEVVAGQGLVVVEAMKMENELKAAGPGTVKKVAVTPGDTVERGSLLLEIA